MMNIDQLDRLGSLLDVITETLVENGATLHEDGLMVYISSGYGRSSKVLIQPRHVDEYDESVWQLVVLELNEVDDDGGS